jgi:hypothetical protein
MDQLKEFKPRVYTPKKVNKEGYDEDGVLHDKCGTPDCCQSCDTAEEQDNDKTID